MGGGKFLTCWFSLNSSETVKAVTLAFCSIEYLLIRDIRPKFGITNSPQSLDIAQNSDGAIYDFQVSRQSFINKNCHNSRSSTDIDMKLKPVTKLEKRNTPTSKKKNKKKKTKKKTDDDVVLANCVITVIFLIHGQFGAIGKPVFH